MRRRKNPRPGRSGVFYFLEDYVVYLVCLVYLVYLVLLV